MKVSGKLAIGDHRWLLAEELTKLLKILNHDRLNARMVGGCVRDALLGENIVDIDLACCLSPHQILERLAIAGVRAIPTGIEHGTVTAVINDRHFEITSLRKDVETYGRHARVNFVDDWTEDARRRDFTINALYLDQDGSLYDPCNGCEDITARRVRFIGEARQRVSEDALRILRFFRFSATIGRGKLDSAGLRACISSQDMINQLSGERLAQEMFKILRAQYLLAVIREMADGGILNRIIPGHNNLKDFNDFVRTEHKAGRCDILARLSCLVGDGEVETVALRLKLSRRQFKRLKRFCSHDVVITANTGQKDIRAAVYSAGRDDVIFALLQYQAGAGFVTAEGKLHNGLAYAENWTIPTFPLSGRDLIRVGLTPGPELGQLLTYLERLWLESDFSLTENQLIAAIPAKWLT